ncbi:GDP-mannose 4,6-dehydratase [Lacunisphaera limnophila]|uniref:GDP-mannose 4,6-dehydratase n=1 Tax=Lacunisphaera limnophila TaxID=1838286 RepID=A0A1D8AYC3_9BACT|nr:GDP-mannose 4,6-dehydratase [Lacunisphaera limnophila]AOS45902.1 GDP-mannose 4,6-dehydratase [Lacunisphaera limnophila]
MGRTTHKLRSQPARRSALILGITGQDGSYLTELLMGRGYAVHGLVRRSSMFNRGRIEHLRNAGGKGKGDLTLHYSDLTDATSLRRIIQKVMPAEVYHLAGQSHVGLSFEIPEVTCQENAVATLALLEILRDVGYPVRVYHAASSELFGAPTIAPQNEATPFNPMNPYGCAKAFAAQMVRVYRQAYGLFAVNGIAYNHESPRRGENFVTRKITTGAARIVAGKQKEIFLGNLDARRDWGWAPEYVVAMADALQAKAARDYVLATGRDCSVREFASAAFAELGLKLKFEGKGAKEVARRTDTGASVLRVDPKFYRPLDSVRLVGDARVAKKVLGWKAKTAGADVARAMARADAAGLLVDG